VPREHRVLGDDAKLLLPGEGCLAISVPAIVEHALVLVGPFLWHLVRRVLRPGREVEKERLLRRQLFGVGDEADGLIDQIGRQVIALFRRLRRLDLAVVVDQVRIVLTGIATQEALVTLEARAAQAASDRRARPR
jgi:hypothetical protein